MAFQRPPCYSGVCSAPYPSMRASFVQPRARSPVSGSESGRASLGKTNPFAFQRSSSPRVQQGTICQRASSRKHSFSCQNVIRSSVSARTLQNPVPVSRNGSKETLETTSGKREQSLVPSPPVSRAASPVPPVLSCSGGPPVYNHSFPCQNVIRSSVPGRTLQTPAPLSRNGSKERLETTSGKREQSLVPSPPMSRATSPVPPVLSCCGGPSMCNQEFLFQWQERIPGACKVDPSNDELGRRVSASQFVARIKSPVVLTSHDMNRSLCGQGNMVDGSQAFLSARRPSKETPSLGRNPSKAISEGDVEPSLNWSEIIAQTKKAQESTGLSPKQRAKQCPRQGSKQSPPQRNTETQSPRRKSTGSIPLEVDRRAAPPKPRASSVSHEFSEEVRLNEVEKHLMLLRLKEAEVDTMLKEAAVLTRRLDARLQAALSEKSEPPHDSHSPEQEQLNSFDRTFEDAVKQVLVDTSLQAARLEKSETPPESHSPEQEQVNSFERTSAGAVKQVLLKHVPQTVAEKEKEAEEEHDVAVIPSMSFQNNQTNELPPADSSTIVQDEETKREREIEKDRNEDKMEKEKNENEKEKEKEKDKKQDNEPDGVSVHIQEKPQCGDAVGEQPQCGDVVVLAHRQRPAVVTKVHSEHCTVIVLDNEWERGCEEYWPSMKDLKVVSSAWRIRERVVIDGMRSEKAQSLNGASATIVSHPKQGHPCFITKKDSPEPLVGLCVRLDPVSGVKAKSIVLEPKFLIPQERFLAQVTKKLESTLDAALGGVPCEQETPDWMGA